MTLDSLFLLSIPIIAALVGWLTNKLAVYMTFYPLEYRGRYPFGWQGIIPAKSHKMATKAVTLVTSKLISVEEQFEKLNAHGIVEEMKPQLDVLSRTIMDDVMREEMPLVWRLLPDSQKEAIQKDAAAQFPATIENVLLDVKSNIHQLLDIDKMMIEGLTARPELLNTIFQQCGEAEFKFIERSGFVFGFLFGLVQMVLWSYYPEWWILPLGGLVVGYLTNFLALKLIFRPVHPIKVGPFIIQGLFMKRQNEVSEQYARILTSELLTAEHIFGYVLETTGLEPIADLLRNHVKQLADNATGRTRKTVIRWTIGTKRFEAIKHRMAERLVEALPMSLSAMFDYADRTLQIGDTLETKLKSLSKEDFEDVLHPIFQEDELTLIIVGAVLGAIAGLIQIAFVM